MSVTTTLHVPRDRTEALETAVVRLRAGTLTPTLVDSLLSLGLEVYVNESERATQLAQEAEEIARDIGYQSGIVHAQLNYAYLDIWRGNARTALEKADVILEQAQSLKDVRLQGLSHELRGSAYLKQGKVGQSLASGLLALELLEQVEDTFHLGSVHNLIAVGYSQLQEPAKAAQHFERAIALCQEARAFRHLAQLYNNLAMNYIRAGQAEEAHRASHEAEHLIRAHDAQHGKPPYGDAYGYLHISRANIHLTRGEWEEALGNVETGLSYNKPTPTKRTNLNLESSLYRVKGEIHLHQEALDDAEAAFLHALQLVEVRGIHRDLAHIHKHLAEIYKRRGTFLQALEHHEQYHTLDKELFTEQHAQQVAMTQTLLETQAARREAELLARKNHELEDLVTELQLLHTQVQDMSQRDGLTGLYNRRYLDEKLAHYFTASLENKAPLYVAMCDIDNFKSVNDNYRHQTGDTVLKMVATILSDIVSAGETDHPNGHLFAARYGGEEFALVMANIPAEAARRSAEHVCQRVREYPWDSIVEGLSVTVSLGVSDRENLSHPEDLLRRADDALYAAKHTGKNRVWLFLTRKKK